jgi:hypothetical protein
MSRRTVVPAIGLALMASACRAEAPGPESRPRASRLGAASQGLCDAQVLASEGNIIGAADVFDAETHDYVHQLAAMLQEVDSEAAAELLEATERVESALNARGDPGAVQDLLIRLQRALHEAAEAADLPAPLCREGAL